MRKINLTWKTLQNAYLPYGLMVCRFMYWNKVYTSGGISLSVLRGLLSLYGSKDYLYVIEFISLTWSVIVDRWSYMGAWMGVNRIAN